MASGQVQKIFTFGGIPDTAVPPLNQNHQAQFFVPLFQILFLGICFSWALAEFEKNFHLTSYEVKLASTRQDADILEVGRSSRNHAFRQNTPGTALARHAKTYGRQTSGWEGER